MNRSIERVIYIILMVIIFLSGEQNWNFSLINFGRVSLAYAQQSASDFSRTSTEADLSQCDGSLSFNSEPRSFVHADTSPSPVKFSFLRRSYGRDFPLKIILTTELAKRNRTTPLIKLFFLQAHSKLSTDPIGEFVTSYSDDDVTFLKCGGKVNTATSGGDFRSRSKVTLYWRPLSDHGSGQSSTIHFRLNVVSSDNPEHPWRGLTSAQIIPKTTECLNGNGESYRGTVDKTASGIPCQRWAAQVPHTHIFYPDSGQFEGLDGNFCRNPDRDERPWCFRNITGSPQYEVCDIPKCPHDELPEYFYEFGETVGDVKLSRSAGAKMTSSLDKSFPMILKNYTSIAVFEDGFIALGTNDSDFQGMNTTENGKFHFSRNETKVPLGVVLPFWTNVRREPESYVVFRQSSEPDLLEPLMRDMKVLLRHKLGKEAAEDEVDFKPTFAIVATWYLVNDNPAEYELKNLNSFQVILSTDGARSFMLLHYNMRKWTDADALVGYNSGEGVQFLNATRKMEKASELSLALSLGSNIEQKGRWLYDVSKCSAKSLNSAESAEQKCRKTLTLTLRQQPRSPSLRNTTVSPVADDCDPNPCNNGGTCVIANGGAICNCPVGFTDNRCQSRINECSNLPCRNGGTCIPGINSYECVCAAGFNGTNCESITNNCFSSPCQNGGTCIPSTEAESGFLCECQSSFTGTNCDLDICIDGTCSNSFPIVDAETGEKNCTCKQQQTSSSPPTTNAVLAGESLSPWINSYDVFQSQKSSESFPLYEVNRADVEKYKLNSGRERVKGYRSQTLFEGREGPTFQIFSKNLRIEEEQESTEKRRVARAIAAEDMACEPLTDETVCLGHLQDSSFQIYGNITTPYTGPSGADFDSQPSVAGIMTFFSGRFMATNCHPYFLYLACTTYLPKCMNSTSPVTVTRPCQDFCLEVKADCESALTSAGVPWDNQLPCLTYPTTDCLGPPTIITTTTGETTMTSMPPEASTVTDVPTTEMVTTSTATTMTSMPPEASTVTDVPTTEMVTTSTATTVTLMPSETRTVTDVTTTEIVFTSTATTVTSLPSEASTVPDVTTSTATTVTSLPSEASTVTDVPTTEMVTTSTATTVTSMPSEASTVPDVTTSTATTVTSMPSEASTVTDVTTTEIVTTSTATTVTSMPSEASTVSDVTTTEIVATTVTSLPSETSTVTDVTTTEVVATSTATTATSMSPTSTKVVISESTVSTDTTSLSETGTSSATETTSSSTLAISTTLTDSMRNTTDTTTPSTSTVSSATLRTLTTNSTTLTVPSMATSSETEEIITQEDATMFTESTDSMSQTISTMEIFSMNATSPDTTDTNIVYTTSDATSSEHLDETASTSLAIENTTYSDSVTNVDSTTEAISVTESNDSSTVSAATNSTFFEENNSTTVSISFSSMASSTVPQESMTDTTAATTIKAAVTDLETTTNASETEAITTSTAEPTNSTTSFVSATLVATQSTLNLTSVISEAVSTPEDVSATMFVVASSSEQTVNSVSTVNTSTTPQATISQTSASSLTTIISEASTSNAVVTGSTEEATDHNSTNVNASTTLTPTPSNFTIDLATMVLSTETGTEEDSTLASTTSTPDIETIFTTITTEFLANTTQTNETEAAHMASTSSVAVVDTESTLPTSEPSQTNEVAVTTSVTMTSGTSTQGFTTNATSSESLFSTDSVSVNNMTQTMESMTFVPTETMTKSENASTELLTESTISSMASTETSSLLYVETTTANSSNLSVSTDLTTISETTSMSTSNASYSSYTNGMETTITYTGRLQQNNTTDSGHSVNHSIVTSSYISPTHPSYISSLITNNTLGSSLINDSSTTSLAIVHAVAINISLIYENISVTNNEENLNPDDITQSTSESTATASTKTDMNSETLQTTNSSDIINTVSSEEVLSSTDGITIGYKDVTVYTTDSSSSSTSVNAAMSGVTQTAAISSEVNSLNSTAMSEVNLTSVSSETASGVTQAPTVSSEAKLTSSTISSEVNSSSIIDSSEVNSQSATISNEVYSISSTTSSEDTSLSATELSGVNSTNTAASVVNLTSSSDVSETQDGLATTTGVMETLRSTALANGVTTNSVTNMETATDMLVSSAKPSDMVTVLDMTAHTTITDDMGLNITTMPEKEVTNKITSTPDASNLLTEISSSSSKSSSESDLATFLTSTAANNDSDTLTTDSPTTSAAIVPTLSSTESSSSYSDTSLGDFATSSSTTEVNIIQDTSVTSSVGTTTTDNPESTAVSNNINTLSSMISANTNAISTVTMATMSSFANLTEEAATGETASTDVLPSTQQSIVNITDTLSSPSSDVMTSDNGNSKNVQTTTVNVSETESTILNKASTAGSTSSLVFIESSTSAYTSTNIATEAAMAGTEPKTQSTESESTEDVTEDTTISIEISTDAPASTAIATIIAMTGTEYNQTESTAVKLPVTEVPTMKDTTSLPETSITMSTNITIDTKDATEGTEVVTGVTNVTSTTEITSTNVSESTFSTATSQLSIASAPSTPDSNSVTSAISFNDDSTTYRVITTQGQVITTEIQEITQVLPGGNEESTTLITSALLPSTIESTELVTEDGTGFISASESLTNIPTTATSMPVSNSSRSLVKSSTALSSVNVSSLTDYGETVSFSQLNNTEGSSTQSLYLSSLRNEDVSFTETHTVTYEPSSSSHGEDTSSTTIPFTSSLSVSSISTSSMNVETYSAGHEWAKTKTDAISSVSFSSTSFPSVETTHLSFTSHLSSLSPLHPGTDNQISAASGQEKTTEDHQISEVSMENMLSDSTTVNMAVNSTMPFSTAESSSVQDNASKKDDISETTVYIMSNRSEDIFDARTDVHVTLSTTTAKDTNNVLHTSAHVKDISTSSTGTSPSESTLLADNDYSSTQPVTLDEAFTTQQLVFRQTQPNKEPASKVSSTPTANTLTDLTAKESITKQPPTIISLRTEATERTTVLNDIKSTFSSTTLLNTADGVSLPSTTARQPERTTKDAPATGETEYTTILLSSNTKDLNSTAITASLPITSANSTASSNASINTYFTSEMNTTKSLPLTKSEPSSQETEEATTSFSSPNTPSIVFTACPHEVTGDDNTGYITWPETDSGASVLTPCPRPSFNMATRVCISSRWRQPDIAACSVLSTRSKELQNWARVIVSAGNASFVAEQIANITSRDQQELIAYDIVNVANILQRIIEVIGPGIDGSVSSDVVSSVSNVIDAPVEEMRFAANESNANDRLIRVVEDVSFLLDIGSEGIKYIDSQNIKIAVSDIDPADFPGKVFSFSEQQFQVTETETAEELPVKTSISLPSSITDDVVANSSSLSRAQFAVYTKTSLFNYTKVESGILNGSRQNTNVLVYSDHVISASLGRVKVEDLSENVTISMSHSNLYVGDGPHCVFWKPPANGQDASWSSEGCHLVESTDNKIVCKCDHLTNFAFIMDVYGYTSTINDNQKTILRILTYIGCGLSIVGLSFTLISYTLFEKLRKDIPSKLLMNLCISLIFANIVFLCLQPAYYSSLTSCTAVAALMHYFVLTSLMWMGLEALNLYIAIVIVFKTYFRRYMLKMALAGWGIPSIIVGISFAVQFGTGVPSYEINNLTEICWLRNDLFYGTLVAPLGLIYLFNTIIYFLVLVQLLRKSSQKLVHKDGESRRNQATKSGKKENIRKLRGAVGLMALLGISWGFAFVMIDAAALTFAYLFVVFNSTQGFWVFIFQCVLKKEVSKSWRRLITSKGTQWKERSSRWSRFSSSNTRGSRSTTTTSARSHSASSIKTSYLVPRSSSAFKSEVSIGLDSNGVDVVTRSSGHLNPSFDDDIGNPPNFPPPDPPILIFSENKERVVRRVPRKSIASLSNTIATQTDVHMTSSDTDSQESLESLHNSSGRENFVHDEEDEERRDSVDEHFGGVRTHSFDAHRAIVMSPSNESGIYSDGSVSSQAPRGQLEGHILVEIPTDNDTAGQEYSGDRINSDTIAAYNEFNGLNEDQRMSPIHNMQRFQIRENNSNEENENVNGQATDSGISISTSSDNLTSDKRHKFQTQDSTSSLFSVSSITSGPSSGSEVSSTSEKSPPSNPSPEQKPTPHLWKAPLVIKRSEDPAKATGSQKFQFQRKPVVTGGSHSNKKKNWKKPPWSGAKTNGTSSQIGKKSKRRSSDGDNANKDGSNMQLDVKMTNFSLNRGSFHDGKS